MRFGEFTVDLRAGEVHRNGIRIRLQELPFRVLAELASRPGEVVTRDELRARLWDASTFVDAEAGLNTAIAKLRDALGDSAESPRFIETLPKRGYRFIAAIDKDLPLAPLPLAPPTVPATPRSRSLLGPVFAAATLLIVLVTIVVAMRAATHKITIAVVLFHNETGRSEMDALAQQLTDATVIALAQNPRYAVIGNAAILRTPRIFTDLKQIGETLQADYIVIAQLQNPPEGQVLRVHFIRAADQQHLWARTLTGTDATTESRVVAMVTAGIKQSLDK